MTGRQWHPAQVCAKVRCMKQRQTSQTPVRRRQRHIFDHPSLCMAGMSGNEAVLPEAVELIPLPEDSRAVHHSRYAADSVGSQAAPFHHRQRGA